VVVKSQVVVDYAVIDVVCLQQMLQRPRPLLRLGFDLVSLYFGQLDAAGAVGPAGEVGQGRPPDLQHAVLGEMGLEKGYRKMPMLLGKRKIGVGRSKASVMQLWLERMTCPAFKVAGVFVLWCGRIKESEGAPQQDSTALSSLQRDTIAPCFLIPHHRHVFFLLGCCDCPLTCPQARP
jgi:hypothetical protein